MYHRTQILLMVGYLILVTVIWEGDAPDELPGEQRQFRRMPDCVSSPPEDASTAESRPENEFRHRPMG